MFGKSCSGEKVMVVLFCDCRLQFLQESRRIVARVMIQTDIDLGTMLRSNKRNHSTSCPYNAIAQKTNIVG